MTDADKYRGNAHYCLRMADDPFNWEHKQTWLSMAETWLAMISESLPPKRMVETAVLDQETQQESSWSQH